MDYSSISSHLQPIAEIANSIIKKRYSLPNGIVNSSLSPKVPFVPTLHWKTQMEYIICEVADRPLPIAVKLQYAEIVATGLPIRIVVAYPHDHGLSGSDFAKEQKTLKALGIGYMSVNELDSTSIEYQGVCVNQKIDPLDHKKYPKQTLKRIQEAHECYMTDGKPDVGLQKLGQLTELLINNAAADAKKKGLFAFAGYKPPEFIRYGLLIEKMKLENVINQGILDRCADFAKSRNAVSHSPKTINQAIKINKDIKDDFSLGLKLIVDTVTDLKAKGLSVKC